MVRARDDAMRELGALKTLKTGTLNIAAHESAAVYLLPGAAAELPDALSGRQESASIAARSPRFRGR